MLLALWKVAPALITGNTMLIKPSPSTPLTSPRFGQIAQSVPPPGVLSVVSGNDELGPRMTVHPAIARISFTGSTATGEHVIRSAAATMKRVTLELGGNDAAIVMPDADREAIVPQLSWGAASNSGQWCVGTKRPWQACWPSCSHRGIALPGGGGARIRHRRLVRLEWLAMPVFMLYPQLAVLKWYRYSG